MPGSRSEVVKGGSGWGETKERVWEGVWLALLESLIQKCYFALAQADISWTLNVGRTQAGKTPGNSHTVPSTSPDIHTAHVITVHGHVYTIPPPCVCVSRHRLTRDTLPTQTQADRCVPCIQV